MITFLFVLFFIIGSHKSGAFQGGHLHQGGQVNSLTLKNTASNLIYVRNARFPAAANSRARVSHECTKRSEIMKMYYKVEDMGDEADNNDGGKGDEGDDEENQSSNDELEDSFEEKMVSIANQLGNNPISRIFTNTYSFFWNFPKKNLPFDTPWVAFKNSSSEFISWYQIPHNLPPYRYVGEGYRDDMFCYGMEGNTLPLGNWDPFGFQLVDKNMMRKYRESELKHGRLAMLACVGFVVQEFYHPLHDNIGGMAITHMAQLQHLASDKSILSVIPQTVFKISEVLGLEGISSGRSGTEMNSGDSYPLISADYFIVVVILSLFELNALITNWSRWEANEYNHQFEHNMGVGNLKYTYRNGDYKFDILGLMPKSKRTRRRALEKELNHCRLAMIAIIGMIGQEYLTGISVRESVSSLFHGGGELISSSNSPSLLENIMSLPRFIQGKFSESGFLGADNPLAPK